MTSPLTEQRTATSLLQLNLGYKTQPRGGFWLCVTSCSVIGGTLEGESRLMDQVVLNTLDSGQWRGCRRDWDGRPVKDLSLPSQTHHSHANLCKEWVGIFGTHLPMLYQPWRCAHGTGPKTLNSSWAVERAQGVGRSLPYTPITVIHVINYLQGGNSKVQT